MTVRPSNTLAAVLGGTILLPLGTVIAQRPDSAIAGTWNLAERAARVVMHVEADGGWTGVIQEPRRREEIGLPLFRALRFDPRQSLWRGSILRPENGATVSVTVRLAGGDTLVAVAKQAFLTKTMIFTRVARAP